MPLLNETIRLGNNSARIKNMYANGLFVIYDIQGDFNDGDVVVGDESGDSIVLTNFQRSVAYDLFYEEFDFDWNDTIILDSGEYIVEDAYFTGLPSQYYQTTRIIVED